MIGVMALGIVYLLGVCTGTPARRVAAMPEIVVRSDESFERALRRFKKQCERAGILSDLRRHRHYEKPSERRKRKMSAVRRKQRRPHHHRTK